MFHYGGSFIKALMDVYPNIGLDITQFTIMPSNTFIIGSLHLILIIIIIYSEGFWKARDHLLSFFNHYARMKGFDPSIASHWYNTSKESIKSLKVCIIINYIIIMKFGIDDLLLQGGESILKECKGSYVKLLMSLYPNIGLQEDQFRKSNNLISLFLF